MGRPRTVDEYIQSAPEKTRPKLRKVRKAVRDAAPGAKESISYRMPYYAFKGRLAWFGLHSTFIGLHLRPPVVEEHRGDLRGYTTTKSAVHFPLSERVPVTLVRKLVKARVSMNDREWEEEQTKRPRSKALKGKVGRRA